MEKGEELVKYLAEQVVVYIETPKEVRLYARQVRAAKKENWQTRWFGMIPLAIRMMAKDMGKDKRTPPQS